MINFEGDVPGKDVVFDIQLNGINSCGAIGTSFVTEASINYAQRLNRQLGKVPENHQGYYIDAIRGAITQSFAAVQSGAGIKANSWETLRDLARLHDPQLSTRIAFL